MDEAVASERDDVGLRVAPARERRRPLARATKIEHRLTQRDHLAVGDPGEHRCDFVGGDRDHDLVQQSHALGDAPLQDQRVTAAQPGEHRRVGIRQALGDPACLDEYRLDGGIALEQLRQRSQHGEPGLR